PFGPRNPRRVRGSVGRRIGNGRAPQRRMRRGNPRSMPPRPLRGWLSLAAMLPLAALPDHSPPTPQGPGVLLLLPAEADPLTERLAASTADYLTTIAAEPVQPLRAPAEVDTAAELEALAAEHHAGLVVVL